MNRSVENGCILVRKSFTNMLPGLTAVLGAMTWKFVIGGVALKVIHTGVVAVEHCCTKVMVAALCWTPLLVVTVTLPRLAPVTLIEPVPSQLNA